MNVGTSTSMERLSLFELVEQNKRTSLNRLQVHHILHLDCCKIFFTSLILYRIFGQLPHEKTYCAVSIFLTYLLVNRRTITWIFLKFLVNFLYPFRKKLWSFQTHLCFGSPMKKYSVNRKTETALTKYVPSGDGRLYKERSVLNNWVYV